MKRLVPILSLVVWAAAVSGAWALLPADPPWGRPSTSPGRLFILCLGASLRAVEGFEAQALPAVQKACRGGDCASADTSGLVNTLRNAIVKACPATIMGLFP